MLEKALICAYCIIRFVIGSDTIDSDTSLHHSEQKHEKIHRGIRNKEGVAI